MISIRPGLANDQWAIRDVGQVSSDIGCRCTDSPKIVYLSIVGPLMLAAAFEWILWLAAFLYCLLKVYQKADHWSIRALAVVMSVLFTLLR